MNLENSSNSLIVFMEWYLIGEIIVPHSVIYTTSQCSHFSDLSSFFKSIYTLCKRVVHVRDWTETYSPNRGGRAFKLYYPVIIWLIFKLLKIVFDLLLPSLFLKKNKPIKMNSFKLSGFCAHFLSLILFSS